MAAYYNEIDPYAAEWLRNLIAAGLIAPGDVDTRSIEDVRPDDLRPYEQCHFFAGIGIWSAALRRVGWPDHGRVWTASCPCQPFSAAGKGDGFADERHLWPAFFHLVTNCRPERIAGEQVASPDGLAWLDLVQTDLESADYAPRAIDTCAAGFGAPNLRQRLYWDARACGMADADRAGRGGQSGARLQRAEIYDADGRSERSRMAYPDGRHASDGDQQRSGQFGLLAASSGAVLLADAESGGSRAGLCDSGSSEQWRSAATDRHCPSRVGESPGARLQGQSDGGRDVFRSCGTTPERTGGEPARPMARAGAPIDLADAESRGCGEQRLTREPGRERHVDGGVEACRPGPVNGAWGVADWLHCRDGKWRPVEGGTFPLAHGDPARLGRLRAYGNSLNLEAAAGFLAVALAD